MSGDYAKNFFLKLGWSEPAAAAIAGGLQAESGWKTTARNRGDGRDGSDSIGLAQWNGDRARALKAYAAQQGADWRDRDLQLSFVNHELNGSESAAGRRLRKAGDVRAAAAAFAGYERPKGWSLDNPEGAHNFSGRYNNALKIAGLEADPNFVPRGFRPVSPTVAGGDDGPTGAPIGDPRRQAVFSLMSDLFKQAQAANEATGPQAEAAGAAPQGQTKMSEMMALPGFLDVLDPNSAPQAAAPPLPLVPGMEGLA